MLEETFDRLDPQQRSDNFSCVRGIGALLEEDLRELGGMIAGAVSDLSREFEEDLDTYLRCLYDPQGDEAALDVERLERETLTCVQELENQKQHLAQLQRYINQLQPVANLNADLDTVRNLQYLFAMMGTIPIANLERLRSSL